MQDKQTKNECLKKLVSQYSLRELLEQKLAEVVSMINNVDGDHKLHKEVITQTETVLIKLVLAETKSQLAAAQLLGINRNTLRKKIKELNLV